MKTAFSHCLICNNNTLQAQLKTQDFSVTQEQFELIKCSNCNILYTNNAPDVAHIAPYYSFDTYISHTDIKKTFFDKMYHAVRKITIKQKVKLITKVTNLNKGLVLDIGCGTGTFISKMQAHNWQTIAVDADEASRNNAKLINNVTAYDTDFLNQLEPNQFDAVTMWHVLEHVHQLKAYIQIIHNALKPGGAWFIAVPNYTSYDAKYYKSFWAAYDVPRHLYHFAPETISKLAELNGFEMISKKPMWFDSFYVSLLSAQHKKSSKIMAVLIGVISNIKTFFNTNNCSSITYILRKK